MGIRRGAALFLFVSASWCAAARGAEAGAGWSLKDPSPSPWGHEVVYVSDVDGGERLWVSSDDGRPARRLTSGSAGDASPAWSPRGDLIAFLRDGGLWVVRAEGGGLRRLSSPEVSSATVAAAAWSPDGRQLAFFQGASLWTVDVPVGKLHRRVDVSGVGDDLSFSPKGTRLVFSRSEDGETSQLWVVALTREGPPIPVTTGPHRDVRPRWTSDGIVFVSDRPNGTDRPAVWIVRPHGRGPEILGREPMAALDPCPGAGGLVVFTNGSAPRVQQGGWLGDIALWNPSTGDLRHPYRLPKTKRR